MKESNPNPEEVKLSTRLREARPAPPLPPRFQAAVWRRIEDGEMPSRPARSPTWLDALAALILRPRVAFATVAAVIAVSASLGVFKGAEVARQDAQARYLASVAPNPLR